MVSMATDGTRASDAAAGRPGAVAGAVPDVLARGWRALVGEAGTTRRRAAVDVAGAWTASHLVVWAAGLVAIWLWGIRSGVEPFDPAHLATPFGGWLDTAVGPGVRWDSVWFLTVARDGYGTDIAKPAFFPLYPLLARSVGGLLGGDVLGGLAVSWASMAVAFAGLWRLTRLELGEGAARHAVWLLALFPAALFGSAVYAESLFLALSVWAVLKAREGEWVLACVLAGLAAGTRSAGIVLLVPLFLLLVRERGWRPRPVWALLLLVPAGLAAFSLWLQVTGGDGFGGGPGWRAPFDAQQQWLREWSGPIVGVKDGLLAGWAGIRQLVVGADGRNYWPRAGGDVIDTARTNLTYAFFLVLAVPALVGVARRLPLAYLAYCLAALAMPLSYAVGPEPLMSLPRFEWVLFPLFAWAGWWLHRRGTAWRVAVYGVSVVWLVWMAAQFATWRWVA